MKYAAIILATAALLALSAAMAPADPMNTRAMANSEFRIAEKAYRSAIEKYGRNITGMPEDEKASNCKKVHWALYDNRIQYTKEDVLTQMKVKRQIQKLTEFQQALGCE